MVASAAAWEGKRPGKGAGLATSALLPRGATAHDCSSPLARCAPGRDRSGADNRPDAERALNPNASARRGKAFPVDPGAAAAKPLEASRRHLLEP